MKTKFGLVLLPLVCAASVAIAQDAGPDAAPPSAASVAVPDKAPTPAPDQAASPAARPRQGADMRHCLGLKTTKAIIRCAEPGRKP
jgi:hypothetical protein